MRCRDARSDGQRWGAAAAALSLSAALLGNVVVMPSPAEAAPVITKSTAVNDAQAQLEELLAGAVVSCRCLTTRLQNLLLRSRFLQRRASIIRNTAWLLQDSSGHHFPN